MMGISEALGNAVTRKTCTICGEPNKKVRWCISCAKDVCGDCWKQHIPECFNSMEHKCYRCQKAISYSEDVIIQGMTGRAFCGDKCHSKYLRSEGL